MLLGIQFENPQNIDISDPVSDQFYHYFRDVARKNALVYEEVFSTLPTDRVRKFEDVSPYTELPKMKDVDPIRVNILLLSFFLNEYFFFKFYFKGI